VKAGLALPAGKRSTQLASGGDAGSGAEPDCAGAAALDGWGAGAPDAAGTAEPEAWGAAEAAARGALELGVAAGGVAALDPAGVCAWAVPVSSSNAARRFTGGSCAHAARTSHATA
jgi:hypothetical protein